MGIRDFDISEFMTHSATLKAATNTIGPDGGYVKTPTAEAIGSVQYMPMTANKEQFAGSPVVNATHSALTADVDLPVNNGDVLTVNDVDHEIIYHEVASSLGVEYLCMYLKEIRE